MLAGFYLGAKDYARTRIEYAKVIQLNPGVTKWVQETEYRMAFVNMVEGMEKNDSALLGNARIGLESYVRDHPTHRSVPKALMNIADLALRAGQYDQVLASYNRIIGFDTTLIDSGRYAGHTDEMKGHRELVGRVHTMKARLLRMQMHNPEAALAEYELLLTIHPHLADALLNKALCLVALNRKSEARPILEQLVSEGTGVKEVASRILSTL